MNLINYSDYENFFAKGGRLHQRTPSEVIRHFHDLFLSLCVDAMQQNKREFVIAFANSRDGLVKLFDIANYEHDAHINEATAATSVITDVAMSLVESDHKSYNYIPTSDDIEFIINAFSEFKEPVNFVKRFQTYEKNIPQIVWGGRHKHLVSNSVWPEEKIGVLYMFGLHLDDAHESAGNHKHFSRRLIENPLISGLNREFKRVSNYPYNRSVDTVVDSYKTDAYKDNQIYRIIEAQAGSYFWFLDPNSEKNHSDGDFTTDLDPYYIYMVNGLLREALHLDIERLSVSDGVNSEKLNQYKLAMSCINCLSDLNEYLYSLVGKYRTYDSMFALIIEEAEMSDAIDELILDSQIMLSFAKRIEELASNVIDYDAKVAFLNEFGMTMLPDKFRLLPPGDENLLSINCQAAFVDYPFNHVENIAIDVLNNADKNSTTSPLHDFLISSPLPLVCRVIQSINDDHQFNLAMSALNLRLTKGCYECLPSRGLDLTGLAITETYALAENRLPHFGKTHSLMDVNECFGLDNEQLLRQYLAIIHKEKGDILNRIASTDNSLNQGEPDMTFVTSGMKI